MDVTYNPFQSFQSSSQQGYHQQSSHQQDENAKKNRNASHDRSKNYNVDSYKTKEEIIKELETIKNKLIAKDNLDKTTVNKSRIDKINGMIILKDSTLIEDFRQFLFYNLVTDNMLNKRDVGSLFADIMTTANISNLRYRNIIQNINQKISAPLASILSKTDDTSVILDDLIAHIINDKILITKLEDEKKDYVSNTEEIKRKYDNLRDNYKEVLNDRNLIENSGTQVINDLNNVKIEKNKSENDYKELTSRTRKILTGKNHMNKKLENMKSLLHTINSNLDNQIKASMQNGSEKFDEIVDEMASEGLEGGGSNVNLERRIIDKLKLSHRDIIYSLSAFYNKNTKTKRKITTLCFILNIDCDVKQNIKTTTEKILKKLKVLTKKEVEYIKNI